MTSATRSCPSCATPLPAEAQFCYTCGKATPTEPGVPARTMATGYVELSRVTGALAGRYKVERVLGEGGMATVYLATDEKHNRKVAVKVMRPELAATLGTDRFLREVQIAAQLSHPTILPMHDSGEADGLLYYVMPYVEGETLGARLKRESQLPVEDAVRLAREVAEALEYAHQKGIIHRDIKPANILLQSGHALVADFGIARAIGGEGEALTATGIAVGTPHYMSPEQISSGRTVDARSDVYAVGAVLYEMLAGEPPFTGPNAQTILSRVMTEPPRSLTVTRRGVPPQLDAVVAKALAKSPADRLPSASALASALASTVGQTTGATPAYAPGAGPSPFLVWGLFGVASVGALATVATLRIRMGLPAWFFAIAVLFLAIGGAVLAMTGRMEQRRRAGGTITGLGRLLTWPNAVGGGAGALALWALMATVAATGGARASSGVRLAVLPFENRGAEADGYLADGIADEIRGKLTNLPGFRVTARTSSDQYRAATKPLKEIGRELEVEYLLTATVRWIHADQGKGRVQVVPELIDARTGEATWQQSYDADVTDVFQVQSAIASKVAVALGVALGKNEEENLALRPTENVAAYDLYLKGKALTSNDPATLRQQAGFYEQAVALDPGFGEAWARLAGALSFLYANGTPDPTVASRAREAAERGLTTIKGGGLGHWGMSNYLLMVEKSPERAQPEMVLALQASPNDPLMLRAATSIEQTLGNWDEALAHLEQARRLDPRSLGTLASLRDTYLRMRRYPEALAVGNDAIAIAPADPNNIESQAMVYLAQGDLATARRLIADAPGSLSRPALLAYMGTYNDLYWVLTDQDQQLMLRLPPSAFFDDPAAWGSVFMQTYWQRGDKVRARAYADTARMAFEEQIRAAPQDPQLHVLYGLSLAYLGQKSQAIAEGEKGVRLLPMSRDARNGAYNQHQLIRIYIMVGEPEKALDLLEPLLRSPYYLSPGWLRIDPSFESLKGNPRFERLLAG
jgi:TolB-like protein/tRNA A-37 threonylcarbamoyl transferase component Bud32